MTETITMSSGDQQRAIVLSKLPVDEVTLAEAAILLSALGAPDLVGYAFFGSNPKGIQLEL